MRQLLFLKPIFKENIWGGNDLQTAFGYPIPSDHTGECWAISGHPNGDCMIENGRYKGMSLNQLWIQHPELFGTAADSDRPSQFPLLVKIIDAKEDLSIQVHPDDTYANIHENGSLGKTECWYILDCAEDASIVIGHHAKTKDELKTMIKNKDWNNLIRTIPIKKGDFFQINPGCVHAIKGGTLILETQQSSDITYRLYDYDRLSNGQLRPLHLSQSIDVITIPSDVECNTKPISFHLSEADLTHYVSCPYYAVEEYRIHGSLEIALSNSFTNVTILEGSGTINGIPVSMGQNLIVTAGYENCIFSGDFRCICSYCPSTPCAA